MKLIEFKGYMVPPWEIHVCFFDKGLDELLWTNVYRSGSPNEDVPWIFYEEDQIMEVTEDDVIRVKIRHDI